MKKTGCADCLKVWSRERDALLRQIDALERQLAAQKVVNRQRAARLAVLATGKTSNSLPKEEPHGYAGEDYVHHNEVDPEDTT